MNNSTNDGRGLRDALTTDGYVVIRQAVPATMCTAVLDAIAIDLGIRVDDPATWDLVSSEIDQVPLWGHQSQWDIRQLPSLHDLWSAIRGTEKLWVSRNSCRFTPPWQPGRADPLPIHWDVDPWNAAQWYPGIVALTDAPVGHGGFRCVPSVLHDRDRWPTQWPVGKWGTEYQPEMLDQEIVEVPLAAGDLLIFDSHLPHGTVRNNGPDPRVVFYLDQFPQGTPEEAAQNIADHQGGRCSEWWRWKPGHDRIEPGPPATLTPLGRRLLGIDPW